MRTRVVFKRHGEPSCFRNPVTCVKFIPGSHSLLLVCLGPYVRFYNWRTGRLLPPSLLLSDDKFRIHRIVLGRAAIQGTTGISNLLIGIVAGTLFKELLVSFAPTVTEDFQILEQSRPWILKDWILDAQYFSGLDDVSKENEIIVFALMHNVVEIYQKDGTNRRLISVQQTNLKCSLYAARIFGHDWTDPKVAIGTVFGQVYIWRLKKPSASSLQCQEDVNCEIEKSLIKHEGAVFGVRFSSHGRYLISVSDDRSICLWDLSQNADQEFITQLYGHQSRVWDCIMLENMNLVSCSEDATARVWRLSTDEWQCMAVWKGHRVKNAWCLDVSESEGVLCTGGGDGAVRLWSMAGVLSILEAEPIPTAEPSSFFSHFGPNGFLLLNTNGDLINYTTPELEATIFSHELLQKHAIISDSLLVQDPTNRDDIYAVGCLTGEIFLVSVLKRFQPCLISSSEFNEFHASKIQSLFLLAENDYLHLFSYSLKDHVLLWHKIILKDNHVQVNHRRRINLPLGVQPTSLALDPSNGYLFCGSRYGCLLIYLLSEHADVLNPIWERRRCHNRDAITSIAIDDTTTENTGFLSVGRNGKLCQWSITLKGEDLNVELLTEHKITKGWLEKVFIVGNEIHVLGFYQKIMFLRNWTLECQVKMHI